MKRQRATTTKGSRIYSYGAIFVDGDRLCRAGVRTVEPTLDRALRQANMYRNKWLEVRCNEQEAYRALRRANVPDLDVLETQLDKLDEEREAACQEIRLRRRAEHAAKLAKARREKTPLPKRERTQYPDINARLDDIAEERRPLYEEIKKVRKPFDKTMAEWTAQRTLQEQTLAVARGYGSWVEGEYKARDNWGKGRVNAEVFAEMLADPKVPEIWKDLQRIKAAFDDEQKLAREWIDIPSGTKGLVEKAVAEGLSSVSRLQQQGVFASVNFRTYQEEGRLGIHFNRGITWEELCQTNGSFCIRRRGEKGKFPHEAYDCWMPLTPGKKPKRAHFLIVEDRPMPPRARIKDLWILAKKRGIRTTFQLQFSCEVPVEDLAREKGKRGTAALHLAYRHDGEGVRVAWLDSDVPILDQDGQDLRGAIHVPTKSVVDVEASKELRSHQDKLWDLIQPTAIEWLKSAPEWAQRQCANIERWRNPIRLIRVIDRLSEERLGERRKILWRQWLDECIPERPVGMSNRDWREKRQAESSDLFGEVDSILEWAKENRVTDADTLVMDWWARKHMHLVDLSERRRTSGFAHRNDWFRVVVARTRRSVARIVIDDQDLRAAAKKAAPNATKELPNPVRGQRVNAAPGKLRQFMVEVFGDDASEVSIKGMAQRCHCGAEIEKSDEVTVVCVAGHSVDRDQNVAQQMLHREWSGSAETPQPARSRSHSKKNRSRAQKLGTAEPATAAE
jgi:hypothetical protein